MFNINNNISTITTCNIRTTYKQHKNHFKLISIGLRFFFSYGRITIQSILYAWQVCFLNLLILI